MSDRWGPKSVRKRRQTSQSRRNKFAAQKTRVKGADMADQGPKLSSKFEFQAQPKISTGTCNKQNFSFLVKIKEFLFFLGTDFKTEFEDDLDTEEVEDTSNSTELKYICPFLICNEKFLWSTDLMEHVQESHTPRTDKG